MAAAAATAAATTTSAAAAAAVSTYPPMPRPPPPPFPPFATYQRAADVLNERFRRSPLTAEWKADGLLADAGLLVHIFDGWEDHAEPWLPSATGPGARDQSASTCSPSRAPRARAAAA